MKIGNLFAVPLVEFRMEDHEDPCRELASLFLERESQGDAYRDKVRRDTQQGALFESVWDLFHWSEAPVQQLTRFCHTSVGRVVHRLSDYSDEEFQALRFDYHSWFHVTRTGGYQGVHNHPNASWSGIFCVDPGDELPERPDSGVVRFHDPRAAANYYIDAGCERLKVPHRVGGYQIRHEAGKLVIFPSYLNHEIFPYQGERPRVVVAFNCWVRQPEGIRR